jgi:hypothetical protein
MPPNEHIPEPWFSFLQELDELATETVRMPTSQHHIKMRLLQQDHVEAVRQAYCSIRHSGERNDGFSPSENPLNILRRAL